MQQRTQLNQPFRQWQWVGVLSSLLVIASGTVSQARNYGSVQLLMGTPSSTPGGTDRDDYLLIRRQYATSYNNTKGTPNWVSWQLNASWIGSVERCKKGFTPDPLIPADFKHVLTTDYTNSGFSRGHMTRSGDRTVNEIDNCTTFYTTNIVPQTQDNNEGPWLELENLARELALAGKELYIIAGPVGEGGKGLKGPMTKIGKKNEVTVPERVWKIVVVLDKPGLGVKGVTKTTRIIAVNMPNIIGVKNKHYTDYLTSVADLEKLTGYNFLSDVPTEIQAVIEAKTVTTGSKTDGP